MLARALRHSAGDCETICRDAAFALGYGLSSVHYPASMDAALALMASIRTGRLSSNWLTSHTSGGPLARGRLDRPQQALDEAHGLARRALCSNQWRIDVDHAEQHIHGKTGLVGGIDGGLPAAALTGGFRLSSHLGMNLIVSEPRRFGASLQAGQFVALQVARAGLLMPTRDDVGFMR